MFREFKRTASRKSTIFNDTAEVRDGAKDNKSSKSVSLSEGEDYFEEGIDHKYWLVKI